MGLNGCSLGNAGKSLSSSGAGLGVVRGHSRNSLRRQAIRTTPFFATSKAGTSDYDSSVSNNNIRNIQIPVVPGQDSVWAYYGCFLDIYDTSNNCSYPGTHHCIVAQIAYDNAPLLFQSGVATNPGNTDKLAQRNLQITLSGARR